MKRSGIFFKKRDMTKYHRVAVLGLFLLFFFLQPLSGSKATLHNASAPSGAFTFEDVLIRFGRPLEDVSKLLDGEILVQDIESSSNRELSVSLGMYVHASPHEVAEAMRTIGWFGDPKNQLAGGEIALDMPEKTFGGVAFDELDGKAALALFKNPEKAGFNLDENEMTAFRSVQKRLGKDADKKTILKELSEVYRQVLLNRFKEYQKGGLAAVRPYAHGKEISDVGQDLMRATKREVLAKRCYPEFCSAISEFPDSPDDFIENRFYWLNQRTGDRSNFILTHRVLSEYHGGVVMSERRFYVSHTYAGQQVTVGVGAINGGSR
jgi:hypothetical protein